MVEINYVLNNTHPGVQVPKVNKHTTKVQLETREWTIH